MQWKVVALSLAALIVVGSGVWLTQSARPYGTGLLTVHKLLDLAAVVLLVFLIYPVARSQALTPLQWTIVIACGVVAAGVFTTGGILSAAGAPPSWALWIHRVAGFVLPIIGAGATLVALGRL